MFPEIVLEDIEDYYTYYVLILGISEDIFWNAEYAFLKGVTGNYSAYNAFMRFEESKMMRDGK